MKRVFVQAPVEKFDEAAALSFARLSGISLSFWQVQLAGWTIYLVMMYVTFLTVAAEGTLLRLLEIKVIRTVIGLLLTCLMREIYRRFGSGISIQKVILLVLSCSIIFGGIWTVSEMGVNWLRNTNFVVNPARIPRNALDYGLTLTAWSALYFGIKYWLAWQREREGALAAVALANQAQLDVLRYQLNPHFLFNSLNSIRASIDEDADRAKRMVTQLSEFLRYSLLNNDAKMISLDEEIEAARNYLAIEKTRFEEKLEIEFAIEEHIKELPVPPFLLNPLVENAVKHGLNGDVKPLKIVVSARLGENRLILEVANTGALSSVNHGTKVGLKNVNERLGKLFGERGKFNLIEENGWVRARIEIKNDEIKSVNR